MTTAEILIRKAKSKCPVSFHYKGQLTEKELSEIEKKCDVKCSSVYMDGSAMYSIRYIHSFSCEERQEQEDKT